MKKYNINEFRAKDWYRLGCELQGRQKRINCFKKAVALDPLHGPAWHYLGVLYGEQGDSKMVDFCNQKALESYKAGLERYRRNLTKEEWLSKNEEKKDNSNDQVTQPIQTYDVITCIDNEIDDILENLGRLYWNLNDLEKAAECYDKLIDLYPNWVKPHKSRGCIYNMLGKHEKAIDDLRFAVEADDTDYRSFYLLGKSYSGIGKGDRANWYFRKAKNAANREPYDIEAKEIRGDSSYELEEYTDSITDYKDILEKNPKNKEVWNKMAEAHLANGDNKEAKRCFEKACKISEQKNAKINGDEK